MTCKANFVHTVKEIMPLSWPTAGGICDPKNHIILVTTATCRQKDLDTDHESYIIIFTNGIRDCEDPADARRTNEKIQARRLETARHPQSTSGRGNRSTLPDRRFLRCRRSRPSQVRDASSRKSGQAPGQPVRFGIRLLPPHLLSGGSRLSARWPDGVVARKTRTPPRAQAHVRRSGLRCPTPCKRSVRPPSGIGRSNSEAVRHNGPPAQHRTRAGPTGKKTPLNPANGARNTAEPHALISAYEELREEVAGSSSSGGLGMALFLGQGMVAWMQACSWVASTTPDNLRRCPTVSGPLPDDLRGEVVLVLAAMALNQAPEVHP
jgi:hypothetical protein